MHTFKTITLLLGAVAVLSSPALAGQRGIPHRHLRVQHGGVLDDDEVANEAGVPGYATTSSTGAANQPPVLIAAAPAAAPAPAPVPPPQGQASTNTMKKTPEFATNNVNIAPGTSTTNVNYTPGTVNTNVNITPGTSTTTVNGATGSAPALRPQPAPAPAPVTKPSTGVLGFDSLNPMTMVATLAHQAHGALLGHTGTVPSSYMQGQGGHGH